jgi:hypothetical protein
VYTDGSALYTSCDGLAVASFAVVQLRGDRVGCGWVGFAGQAPAYLSPSAAAPVPDYVGALRNPDVRGM